MALIVKMVNIIIAKSLNHRQFCGLLEEADFQYSNLFLHNKVQWLSWGRVLEHFAACSEVKTILLTHVSKKLTHVSMECITRHLQ